MPFAPPRARPIIALAIALISVAYLAQIPTPLRLVNDGVDYLLQASSAVDGHGFLVHGARSMRPPGYPALIFVSAKAGLANSWAIVALNCLLLAIGCWAAYFVLRDSFEFSLEVAQLISLFTLLSFLMVRNVTYPLSDVCFFGVSVACLLFLISTETAPGWQRFWRLVILIPLILLCIELRTIGVVLIPPFVWAALGGAAGIKKIYPALHRHRFFALALLLVALVAVGKTLLDSRYMKFNSPIFHHRGVLGTVALDLEFETTEWGEMAVNAPLSKLPAALRLPLQVIGACALLAALIGICSAARMIFGVSRRILGGSAMTSAAGDTAHGAQPARPYSLLIYLLGFGAIVFAYPWFDTRLWLPVFPFLMGYALLGLRRILPPRILQPTLLAYCTLFSLLGIAALAYSTRLTYAGPRFPDLYGDGNLRATYKFALLGEAPKNPSDLDPDSLYLLQRFEWRAARR